VALVTLGCARNEVDSEELAGRLVAGGFTLVEDPDDADAVLVNTCGFIDAAKRDSIDVLMAAGDGGSGRPVVAVGCLAERYGEQLAGELPEAAAVLGFDAYPQIADHLRRVLAGERLPSHTPRDRRALLPLTPVARPGVHAGHVPGHGDMVGIRGSADAHPVPDGATVGPAWIRRRIGSGPVASLKIASGCDRRCAFCAIPPRQPGSSSRGRASSCSSARTRRRTARTWQTPEPSSGSSRGLPRCPAWLDCGSATCNRRRCAPTWSPRWWTWRWWPTSST
jgi:tRNA A37 methylthiotransferase MiaB